MRRFDEAALVRLERLLGRRPAAEIDGGSLRRACVVIPLVRADGEWSILFSRRSADLRVHSGQVSFPGGSVDPNDESLEIAALRETEEEIGIPADRISLIGRLDDVITRTGFLVAPFAGVIRERLEYVLQPSEVDEVFEVPVERLLEPSNPEIRHLDFMGDTYPVYYYHHGTHEIWGLTGRILKSFLDLVRLAL